MNKVVYIIVLNFNTWEDTIECVESLLRSTYLHYKIVVVDNASVNQSSDYIKLWLNNMLCCYLNPTHQHRHFSHPPAVKAGYLQLTDVEIAKRFNNVPRITFIQSEKNGGYAAGNNIGLTFCSHQEDFSYAWVINNDTVVAPESLGNMMHEVGRLAVSFPSLKFGIFGNKISRYDTNLGHQASYYQLSKLNATVKSIVIEDNTSLVIKDCDYRYPCGASIMVSKEFLNDVGIMSEEYFLYYEEPDWTIRARLHEYCLAIFNGVPILHKEGASAGSNSDGQHRGELSDFYLIKNRFTLIRKFFPRNIPFVYLTMLGIMINRIARRQYKRVFMILKIIKNELNSVG